MCVCVCIKSKPTNKFLPLKHPVLGEVKTRLKSSSNLIPSMMFVASNYSLGLLCIWALEDSKTDWWICYLSFFVDTNNAWGRFMRSCDKNSVSTNTVHVDANSRLQVIHVNITILRDQVDNAMLNSNLPKDEFSLVKSKITTVKTAAFSLVTRQYCSDVPLHWC